MKVSTKGRYGLRAMVDMAANSQEGPISLVQTAKRQNISLNYLEQVFGILRKAGIVVSVKGAGGGYKLARSASEITVKEILEALEGEFSIIDKTAETEMDAVQRAIQELVWDEIDSKVNELLGERTLGELVREYQENLDYSSNMYYI